MTAGGPPQDRNWLALPDDASRITTRHYFENERAAAADPDIHVPLRIDVTTEQPPAAPPHDASIAAGIRRVSNFLRSRTLEMPRPGEREQPPFVSTTPNQFPPPVKPGDFTLAAADAAYSMAPFVLGPDQALIMRGSWPACRCANVSLWNRHMQTFDFASRSVSLNRRQTALDGDGRFEMVLAHADPGVPNWLDTEGRGVRHGLLAIHAAGGRDRDAGRRGRTVRRGRASMSWRVPGLAALLGALLLCVPPLAAAEEQTLLLATTTSVQDSGLLDALLPEFTRQTGIEVSAVAVGTGAALRMGSEGNADVLLTHAPSAEEELVASGAIDRRVEIMENHFVLAGPAADPAAVKESASVADALRAIRGAGAPFVSRADDSGTHKREVALFREAGLDPDAEWPGLTRTGSGMGLSLQVAGQKGAYVLSDVGTFLAFRERTGLHALSKAEPALRNVYSILRVSPARFPRVHAAEADAFIAFVTASDTRERIAGFGKKRLGRALFPAAPAGGLRPWPSSRQPASSTSHCGRWASACPRS